MVKTISIVDVEDVVANWNEYSALLERALAHNDGSHTLSGLLSGLLLGKYKLIVCKVDSIVSLICIIEFINYPTKKICNIAFLAGKDTVLFKDDFMSFVFQYAKLHAADSVQIYGRKGWKRFLSEFEFKEIYTVLERKI